MSFFRAEDFTFGILNSQYSVPVGCAEIANKLLEERGVRVSGYQESEYKTWHFSSQGFESTQTHKAFLINIEEVKECEHEPEENFRLTGFGPIYFWNCKHCGIKLKAKWEPI